VGEDRECGALDLSLRWEPAAIAEVRQSCGSGLGRGGHVHRSRAGWGVDEERGACRLPAVNRPLHAFHPLMFSYRHIRAAATEAAKPLNVYPGLSLVVKTGMGSRDNWKEGRCHE